MVTIWLLENVSSASYNNSMRVDCRTLSACVGKIADFLVASLIFCTVLLFLQTAIAQKTEALGAPMCMYEGTCTEEDWCQHENAKRMLHDRKDEVVDCDKLGQKKSYRAVYIGIGSGVILLIVVRILHKNTDKGKRKSTPRRKTRKK